MYAFEKLLSCMDGAHILLVHTFTNEDFYIFFVNKLSKQINNNKVLLTICVKI
jgi:hypothetical protein